MAKQGRTSKITLKPGSSIGEPAAEDDARYLDSCFVGHPAIDALKDTSSNQCLIVGRTGAGKSAVLCHFEKTLENVTRIDPKEVAFQYLGNSAVVREMSEQGVDLHTLYEFLWTHILTLHITQEFLGVKPGDGGPSVIDQLQSLLWNDKKRQRKDKNVEVALNYLKEHGFTFFNTIEEVSAEFADEVVKKAAGDAGVSAEVFRLKVEGGSEWRESERRVFRRRAQEAVSSLQLRDLKETINALSVCLEGQKKYYVVIDDLDLEWAGEDSTQYALIRALIESLKTFRRIPNLKIIAALREDLFEATIRETADKHFQLEKLEGVIRRLRWSDTQLKEIVRKRVTELFRFVYTKESVDFTDVIPDQIQGKKIGDYLVERTLRRPRDIIAFVNKILSESEGVDLPLPAKAITKVERSHSADRLRALEDEWRSCHHLVGTYIHTVNGLDQPIQLSHFTEDNLMELIFEVGELNRGPCDQIEKIALMIYKRNKQDQIEKLAKELLACLYKLGVVGAKLSAGSPLEYSYEKKAVLSAKEISRDSTFWIHPMLAPTLGHWVAKKRAA